MLWGYSKCQPIRRVAEHHVSKIMSAARESATPDYVLTAPVVVQDAVQSTTAIVDGVRTSTPLNTPALKTVFANPIYVMAPVRPIRAGDITAHMAMRMVLMTGTRDNFCKKCRVCAFGRYVGGNVDGGNYC